MHRNKDLEGFQQNSEWLCYSVNLWVFFFLFAYHIFYVSLFDHVKLCSLKNKYRLSWKKDKKKHNADVSVRICNIFALI